MSTDLDSRRQRKAIEARGGLFDRVTRRRAVLGRNLASFRAFVAGRRRDRRFRILPYDGFQVANAAAVTLSALALLVLLIDPYLTAWHATLPAAVRDVFDIVTDLGRSHWILIGTGAVLIFALIADAGALTPRLRMRRAVHALAALYVFLSVAIPGIAVNLTKYALGRARPRHFDESGSFAFDFWSGDASWASFPSGHATTGMGLGVALALLFPRLRWVFLTFGFWIAVSRLFTRAHYPSDVLAGSLIGGGSAWLIARAFAARRLVFGFDRTGRLVRRRKVAGGVV